MYIKAYFQSLECGAGRLKTYTCDAVNSAYTIDIYNIYRLSEFVNKSFNIILLIIVLNEQSRQLQNAMRIPSVFPQKSKEGSIPFKKSMIIFVIFYKKLIKYSWAAIKYVQLQGLNILLFLAK